MHDFFRQFLKQKINFYNAMTNVQIYKKDTLLRFYNDFTEGDNILGGQM